MGRSAVRGGNVTSLEHANRVFSSSVCTSPGIFRQVTREEEVPAGGTVSSEVMKYEELMHGFREA